MNNLNCFEYVTLAYPVLMDLLIQSPCTLSEPLEGGGGVLGLEKGTNCRPTNAERWLSRREIE